MTSADPPVRGVRKSALFLALEIAGVPARIGYWVDTICNHPFDGGLDEVAVYPSALPADRAGSHFAAATA